MSFDVDQTFETMYERELTRERHLTSLLTIPAAGLAVLGGALVYLAEGFPSYGPNFVTGLFGSLLAVTSAFFVYALIQTFHTLRQIPRKGLAGPDLWGEVSDVLEKKSPVEIGAPERKDWVRERFAKALRMAYQSAAERLQESNDLRSRLFFNALRAIVYSGIALVPATIVYLKQVIGA